MKKYILLSLAALFLASCSKDEAEEIATDTLVPVTIGASTSMSDNSTRTVWSNPSADAQGVNTIAVKFKPGETMDVYELDHSGYQTFTCTDATELQNGNFSGFWHATTTEENAKRWAAILPSNTVLNSDNANSVTLGASDNTYELTIPSTQTTELKTTTSTAGEETTTTYVVSPDTKANIMVGAKNTHGTATCFLSPICAYLYFATPSSIKTVKVSSSTPLVGSISVTTGAKDTKDTSGNAITGEWDGWVNFVNCIKAQSIDEGKGKTEITVTGVTTHRSDKVGDLTEYIVCVFPTAYNDLTITTTDGTLLAKSTKAHTFNLVNLYYLGKFSSTHTVSYDANGGSGSVAPQSKTTGTALTLSSGDGLSREGYKLGSWNTKADGTGKTYALGGSYTNDLDVTLYAIWQ